MYLEQANSRNLICESPCHSSSSSSSSSLGRGEAGGRGASSTCSSGADSSSSSKKYAFCARLASSIFSSSTSSSGTIQSAGNVVYQEDASNARDLSCESPCQILFLFLFIVTIFFLDVKKPVFAGKNSAMLSVQPAWERRSYKNSRQSTLHAATHAAKGASVQFRDSQNSGSSLRKLLKFHLDQLRGPVPTDIYGVKPFEGASRQLPPPLRATQLQEFQW